MSLDDDTDNEWECDRENEDAKDFHGDLRTLILLKSYL